MNGCLFSFLVQLIVSCLVKYLSTKQPVMVTAVTMILRPWANRSRSILIILLTFFAMKIVEYTVSSVVYINLRDLAGMCHATLTYRPLASHIVAITKESPSRYWIFHFAG